MIAQMIGRNGRKQNFTRTVGRGSDERGLGFRNEVGHFRSKRKIKGRRGLSEGRSFKGG